METSIYNQRQLAYKQAEQIDLIINNLIQKYPIKDYPYFWGTLARTISSGMVLLDASAMEQVKLNERFRG